jgi:hypothetical protein
LLRCDKLTVAAADSPRFRKFRRASGWRALSRRETSSRLLR